MLYVRGVALDRTKGTHTMTEERTPIHYGMDVTYLGGGRDIFTLYQVFGSVDTGITVRHFLEVSAPLPPRTDESPRVYAGDIARYLRDCLNGKALPERPSVGRVTVSHGFPKGSTLRVDGHPVGYMPSRKWARKLIEFLRENGNE